MAGRRFAPLRAFLWLRWRLAANALVGGKARDMLASFGAWMALVLRIVLGLLLLGATVAVAGICGVLTYGLVGGGVHPDVGYLGLRAVLGTLSVLLIAMPLMTRTGGDLAAADRLRLLPVRDRHLDLLDLAGAFADPWLLLMVPLPVVMSLALVIQGEIVAAGVALVAGLLLLLAVALASTAVRRVAGLILRDRRRAETAMVVGIVGVTVLSMSTVWLDPEVRERKDAQEAQTSERPVFDPDAPTVPTVPAVPTEPVVPAEPTAPADQAQGGSVVIVRTEPIRPGDIAKSAETDLRQHATRFPAALHLVPSELMMHAVHAALEGELGLAVACLLGLVLLSAVLYAVARRLWRATIASPAISGPARAGGVRLLSLRRLPWTSPAASAVAWAQLTIALRTPAGKLALMMPTLVMLMVAVPLRMVLQHGTEPWVAAFVQGPQIALGGVAMVLLSIQPFALNQFAADGDGLARSFLAPVGDRDLVLGKAWGLGLLSVLSCVVMLGVSAALVGGGSVGAWLAILLAFVPVYLVMAPVSVALSLLFPKATDLGELGSKGKPHQLATLGGLALLGVALTPAALVGAGLVFLDAPWLVATSALLVTAVTALLAVPALRLVAMWLPGRREALLAAVREK